MHVCTYLWWKALNIPFKGRPQAKCSTVKEHDQKHRNISFSTELVKLMSSFMETKFHGDQFNFFLGKHDRLRISLTRDLFLMHTPHSILQSWERSPWPKVLIIQAKEKKPAYFYSKPHQEHANSVCPTQNGQMHFGIYKLLIPWMFLTLE